MTQVFLTKASTSPWAVPGNMSLGQVNVTNTAQALGNYFFIGDSASDQGLLQTWASTYTGSVDTITVVPAKAGSPADNLICAITDSTGNTVLSTAPALPASAVGTNGQGQNYTFRFNPPVHVVNGTTYGFTLKRSGGTDASNYWRPIGNTTGGYAGGTVSVWNGTTWTVQSGWSLSFDIGYKLHTVEMVGAGGNGAAGTTGSSGNGGGGGCGGNYQWFRYLSGTITPGTTTIGFFVDAGGGNSYTMWENNTLLNCYVAGSGGNASGTGGGTAATGNHNGTPPITYQIPAWGWSGGAGGPTALNKGGGGGGGCAGPDSTANAPTVGGTGGAGGVGGDRGGNAAGAGSGSTFGAGGQGMTGTPGSTSGAAGTGASGGAGSSATTTTGSTGGAGGGTDTGFDASHGFGGGGGGAGAATSSGTYTITGGNGGNYGAGGGGCGYGFGTATFVTGKGGDGLIALFLDVVSSIGGTLPSLGVG